MSRRCVSTFVAAGAAALLATAAGAQMNSGAGGATRRDPARTGSGLSRDAGTAAGSFDTVVSVDPSANRIVVENATGERRTVQVETSTGILRRGAPGTATTMQIAQLTPGDRIIVSGNSRAGGFTAQRIEVLPGGMTAPGMPNANPASPPGSMRPGDPNATPPGDTAPRPAPGSSPSSPSGGGMGGSGTGGSGAGAAGSGAGGGGGGGR